MGEVYRSIYCSLLVATVHMGCQCGLRPCGVSPSCRLHEPAVSRLRTVFALVKGISSFLCWPVLDHKGLLTSLAGFVSILNKELPQIHNQTQEGHTDPPEKCQWDTLLLSHCLPQSLCPAAGERYLLINSDVSCSLPDYKTTDHPLWLFRGLGSGM